MPRITVGVRIRPDLGGGDRKIDNFSAQNESKTLEFSASGTTHSFSFDDVYLEGMTQKQVFSSSAKSIVEAAIDGYNGTVFAYGQTGAGKTHTMCGALDRTIDDYGLCGLATLMLFDMAQRLSDATLAFRLSVMEIYNETCIDLSVEPPTPGPGGANPGAGNGSAVSKLNIIETESGVVVPGLRLIPVSSADEALTLIMDAQANRSVAEHLLNQRSSRSHLIYTFYITRSRAPSTQTHTHPSRFNGEPEVHQSKLHLVDLAGSERTNKTGSSGSIQKEANFINRSLSYLEQVVLALTQTKRDHIPFRQSKLTYLLKDSLGGNGNTYLIACIWPRKDHVWETLSTLRFAARMKAIEMHPIRNRLVAKEQAPSRLLQQQLDLLRKELALRDFITHPSAVGGGGLGPWLPDMTKAQRLVTYKSCVDLALSRQLDADQQEGSVSIEQVSSALPLQSMSQAYLAIQTLAMALREACQQDLGAVQAALQTSIARVSEMPMERVDRLFAEDLLGERGDGSSPTAGEEEDQVQDQDQEQGQGQVVSREAAFDSFCGDEGLDLHGAYEQAKETLRAAKTRQKEIVALLNGTKASIDRLAEQLESVKASSETVGLDQEGGGQGDEAETMQAAEQLRVQLSQAKKSYRIAHQELTICKEQIVETQSLKARAMTTLLNAFNEYLVSHRLVLE